MDYLKKDNIYKQRFLSSTIRAIMHCVTNQWKLRRNYKNSVSNCFRIHGARQIWLPATFLFLRLYMMFYRRKFLSNKKVLTETEVYFHAKDKSIIKMLSKNRMNGIIAVSSFYASLWAFQVTYSIIIIDPTQKNYPYRILFI